MKDLDFLQQSSIRIKDIIILEEKDSLVFEEIKKKIYRELVPKRCDGVREIDLKDLMFELDANLFDKNLYVISCGAEDINSDMVREFEVHRGNNSILIVLNNSIESNKNIDPHSFSSTVIQATVWSKGKWESILKDLLSIFYPGKSGVKNLLQIKACLQELKENHCLTLPDFLREFHFTCNTFVGVNNEGQVIFDWTSFKKHYEKNEIINYYSIHKMLEKVLNTPTEANITNFLVFSKELESFKSGARSYVDLLYRVIFDLMTVNQALIIPNKEETNSHKDKLLKIYANMSPDIFLKILPRLSEWESCLIESSDLLLSLRKMFEDYAKVLSK